MGATGGACMPAAAPTAAAAAPRWRPRSGCRCAPLPPSSSLGFPGFRRPRSSAAPGCRHRRPRLPPPTSQPAPHPALGDAGCRRRPPLASLATPLGRHRRHPESPLPSAPPAVATAHACRRPHPCSPSPLLTPSEDRGWGTMVKWMSGLSLCMCVRTCFVGCPKVHPLLPTEIIPQIVPTVGGRVTGVAAAIARAVAKGHGDVCPSGAFPTSHRTGSAATAATATAAADFQAASRSGLSGGAAAPVAAGGGRSVGTSPSIIQWPPAHSASASDARHRGGGVRRAAKAFHAPARPPHKQGPPRGFRRHHPGYRPPRRARRRVAEGR